MKCCEKASISRRRLGSGAIKLHCRTCGGWVIETAHPKTDSIPPASLADRVQTYLSLRRTLGRGERYDNF